jgi:hypothetical protein
MEIRIYFESIEQAYHYVLPIVQKSLQILQVKSEVQLVKLARNYGFYAKRVAPLIFWKEPDILISVVDHEIEYPVLLVEFSSAVFTEDHELQRFDGLVAAAKSNCIYAKISPTKKKSPSEHGGNVEFDYVGPFSLIYRKFGKLFFHFEWECDKIGVVKVDSNYLSCPTKIDEFEQLIHAILTEMVKTGFRDDWIERVATALENRKYFHEWIEEMQQAPKPEIALLNSSRTRWLEQDDFLNCGVLELKLNRLGHAMDPERGMLAYYGIIGEKTVSKMIFDEENDAWYKDIPKEEEIADYIKRKGLKTPYDFIHCFALGSGLHSNSMFMEIVKTQEKTKSDPVIIDLSEFIKQNLSDLSKPLKTIFAYSLLFVIENTLGERKVIFRWESYDESTIFGNYADATMIKERAAIDEDDVTYITVHNILRPNGYSIIAVSYPGAQADRVILVEPKTGRRQKRKYLDVISYLPKKNTNLQENKGVYQSVELQRDIIELTNYKREEAYKDGLETFLERYGKDAVGLVVKIGVGFWAHQNFALSDVKNLNLKDIDYFIYITSDREKWAIWRTGKDDMFSLSSGNVCIPKTYEVIYQDKSLTNLRDFL